MYLFVLIFPEAHQPRAIQFGLSFDFAPYVVIFSIPFFGKEEDDELLEYFRDGYNEDLSNQSSIWKIWKDSGLCTVREDIGRQGCRSRSAF